MNLDSIKKSIKAAKYALRKPYTIDIGSYTLYIIVNLLLAFLPASILKTYQIMLARIENLFTNSILDLLLYTFLLYIILKCLNYALTIVERYIYEKLNDKIKLNIECEIMYHYKEIDMRFLENSKFQDIFDTINNSHWALIGSILWPIELLKLIISFLSIFIVLASINPVLCLVFLLTNIPVVMQEMKVSKKLEDWNYDSVHDKRLAEYYKSILIKKQYAKELRIYNLKKFFIEKFNYHNDIIIKYKTELYNKSCIKSVLLCIPALLGYAIIFIYSVLFVRYNKLAITDFAVIVTSLFVLSDTFTELIDNLFTYFSIYTKRIINYLEFLDFKSELNKGTMIITEIREIEFCNVWFKYPENENYVIKNLNLKIEANKKVAFVGYNGAGKTTIVKLILRLYDPTKGKILVNGIEIEKYDIQAYRQLFSTCFQDFIHYSLSVSENISINVLKNDNNVDELIKKVGLDDVINQFPKKSSQPLTKNLYDDGEELSGGQWQRIAIARCLNRVNASVYLFDEASAALDPLSEKDIYDTIKEISNKKIIIFITHRLSNMDIFDEVYMFKDGVLIEQGSHERLVEANSEYAKYYVFQKKKFEKGVQNEEN